MRKLSASITALLPLLAAAQVPAQTAPPQYAPPAQYAPPPQYAPAPQYAPPPQYYAPAPPYPPPAQPVPAQYAPPPQSAPQYYAPGPQYAPPQQYAPAPQYYAPAPQYYAPPPQYAPAPQYAPPPQYAPAPQYAAPYAPGPQYGPASQYPPPASWPPAPPAQLADRPRHQRGTWYFGVGLGGGDARLSFKSEPGDAMETRSLREIFGTKPTKVAANLRLGATLSPRFLLGADLSMFSASATYNTDVGEAKNEIRIDTLTGVITFFPAETGLFLRAGAGAAHFTASSEVPGMSTWKEETSGLALTGGIGYALWVGRSANIVASLDVSGQSYARTEPTVPDASTWWAFRVGLDWY